MNFQSEKLYIRYLHHGMMVWVRSDLLGSHKAHCLCWSCEKLHPGQPTNCPIAQKIYELDVKHNLVTPVYECPEFALKFPTSETDETGRKHENHHHSNRQQ